MMNTLQNLSVTHRSTKSATSASDTESVRSYME